MITNVLNSHKTTLFLTILFLVLLMLTYGVMRSSLLASDKTDASFDSTGTTILYFVPEVEGKIEERLTPESLSRSTALENNDLIISATTSWKNARELLADQNVKAILIHHAALDLVNRDELQDFFESQGVVVTGLGIPGLELARFLGHPTLFTSTWPGDGGYTTPYYFYTYSLTVSGSDKEFERLQENGWSPGEQLPSDVVVSDPLGVTSGSSTDSLLAEENMDQLFSVIRAHLLPTEPLILPPD